MELENPAVVPSQPLPAPAPRAFEPVAAGTLAVYAAPAVGFGFMFVLTSMYLMKFSTDVLDIAPAAMGTIFFVSRVWDAFSDPLAGFLSDRTRSRLGRRRPWLLAGAIPVGIAFFLMWSPPASLTGRPLTLWMGAMVVLFYTGMTAFLMPHDSLGAELSSDYHERNRIFALKRLAWGLGSLLVFFAVARLTDTLDPRRDARWLAASAGLVTVVLMLYTGVRIRERAEYQGRGSTRPFAALADVLRNPHARLLLVVFFLQQLGMGALVVSAAYHAEYVLGSAQALPLVLGSFFVSGLASIPLWVALGRRFDKKQLLVASMAVIAVTMACIFCVGEGELAWMLGLAALGGAAGGCPDVIFPSVQADVIDYDEYRTGERKEGIYFAGWSLAAKSATGCGMMVTGLVLAASGFEPNVEQGAAANVAIRALMSLFPCLCYGAGALAFLRFGLTQQVHAEIRRRLDHRP